MTKFRTHKEIKEELERLHNEPASPTTEEFWQGVESGLQWVIGFDNWDTRCFADKQMKGEK
jgi:hypothetical protein